MVFAPSLQDCKLNTVQCTALLSLQIYGHALDMQMSNYRHANEPQRKVNMNLLECSEMFVQINKCKQTKKLGNFHKIEALIKTRYLFVIELCE